MEQPDVLQRRVEFLIKERIEEKAYSKIVKEILCLAYAYVVKKKMLTITFPCLGCEENQPNQLAHDCVMLTSEEILDINLEKAMNDVCHANVMLLWRDIAIRSCVPPLALHNIMQDTKLRSVDYVKNNYILKIKKYLNKIEDAELKAFL